jgi:predicted cobalt transporter CbtA
MEQITQRPWTIGRIAKYVGAVLIALMVISSVMLLGLVLFVAGDLPPAPLP